METNIVNDQANHILNNSIWFIDTVDFDKYFVSAIIDHIETPDAEKHTDILGRLFTETPSGDVWLRVTRAHYGQGKFIISEHTDANKHVESLTKS